MPLENQNASPNPLHLVYLTHRGIPEALDLHTATEWELFQAGLNLAGPYYLPVPNCRK